MRAIFLDSETNGLDSKKHWIVDLAYIIIDLETGKELHTFNALVQLSKEEWDLSMKESLNIHKIPFEEISEKGLSRNLVKQILIADFRKYELKRGSAVFICQNPSFDRNFLEGIISAEEQNKENWPYHWLDLASMHWALSIKSGTAPWLLGFSKDKIAKLYGLEKEQFPHRALGGTKHLLACYEKLLGFPKL